MKKLDLSPELKVKKAKRKEPNLELIDQLVTGHPELLSIVGVPVGCDVFKDLSEEKKDLQICGERSELLSQYFHNIASMVIREAINENQFKFRQFIVDIYNNELSPTSGLVDLFNEDHDQVSSDLIISFARILLCEMFTFNNSYYDSCTHQLNRHPRETIEFHDLCATNQLEYAINQYTERLYNIKYYLMHSDNFMELLLAIVSQFTVNVSVNMNASIERIKRVNLTVNEYAAFNAAVNMIGHIFSKYSMDVLESLNSVLNVLTDIAHNVNSGTNIVNYLPRNVLNTSATFPIDFNTYLEMEKKARKAHIGKSVGFVVDETTVQFSNVRENLYKED